jgi:preprotein translocase subunit SecE
MSEENKNLTTDETVEKVEEKKEKSAEKKPNFFVRAWTKLVKFIKDTKGEMKKVVWMSKGEVWKSFKLVIATVVAISIAIAIVDVASSFVINTIAGLIG